MSRPSYNPDCEACIHERICDIWGEHECQDAACYVDDCFEPKDDGWIRTEERLPEVAEPVLVAREVEIGRSMVVEQGILLPGGVWKTFGHKLKRIKYWRPLPPPPEE